MAALIHLATRMADGRWHWFAGKTREEIHSRWLRLFNNPHVRPLYRVWITEKS